MEAKENIYAEKIEEEFSLIVEGTRNKDNEELFKRSVFVVAISFQSSSEILDSVLAEGVNCLVIKPMGDLLHLITSDSLEDKVAISTGKQIMSCRVRVRVIPKRVSYPQP